MRPYFVRFLFACFLMGIGFCFAQQTPKMTSGGTGYLEKLPPDYATNPGRKYPVLFFLHGSGEVGNGTPTDLQKVKAWGPPALIEAGNNMCFTVNGVEDCFIVISPQLRPGLGGWWASVLNDVFDYVLNGPNNYRIDKNRVYLTGLSLGGQGVYIGVGDATVPDIFAAGAPVSAFGNGNGCRISARKIPMWGFHGTADGTISYSTGLTEFNNIVTCTTPTPTAELKWTPYVGLGHNIWNDYAYRTDNNLATPNLYQWLLTKSKGGPPTAQAGPDITLVLPTSSVTINGSGLASGSSSIVSYAWSQQSGGTATINNANAATVNISDLVEGTYVFRLTVTDDTGKTGFDDVTVIVTYTPNLIITNPSPVCAPNTVDITQPAITAGSTSGLTYTYWTDVAATVALPNPNSLSAGTYYIKALTSVGGSNVKPVVVNINPIPTLLITNPNPICVGAFVDLTLPSVTSGSSPGQVFTYWSDSQATSPLNTPSAVAAGTYYIKGTLTSTNCYSIKPVVISNNPAPTLIITNPSAICINTTTDITKPSITAGSSPGLTFSYWMNASATVAVTNPTAVASGTYFIKAVNSFNCSDIKAVTIGQNQLPILVITNPAAVCAPALVNITAASITIGSSPSLSFSYWSDASATTPLSNPNAVGNGIFYIKATNVAGCSSIAPVTVTVNNPPSLSITNPTICINATADLTRPAVTNGSSPNLTFTYWQDSNATVILFNPSAVGGGTYYIKGTSSAGCSSVASVTVIVNSLPSLTITNPAAVCSPAVVDITSPNVTSGSSQNLTFTYWRDANATVVLSNPGAVGAGTFYIKGTNSAGCSSVGSVVVTVNNLPSLSITNPAAVCSPSSVDITLSSVTNGSSPNLSLSYWSDAGATNSLSNPTAVGNGTFYIKGTNSFGCSSVAAVNATVNNLPILVITNPSAVCAPNKVDITKAEVTAGSSPNVSFSYWQDSGTSVLLTNATSVNSGVYYIKATNGFNCYTIKPISVVVNPLPTLMITNPPAICEPNTIDLTNPLITSGSSSNLQLSYWTDANGTQPVSNAASINSSSTYFIKGLDTNGCFALQPVNTTVYPQPKLPNPSSINLCGSESTSISLATVNSVASTFSWTANLTGGQVSGFTNGSGNVIAQALQTNNGGGSIRYNISAVSTVGNCASTSSYVDVNVGAVPVAAVNLTASSSVICNGCGTNIVLLNTNNVSGTTFSWTATAVTGNVTGQSAGSGNIISQALTKSSTYGTVRYFVKPKAGNCVGNEITFDVKLNNPPVANAGSNQTITLPNNSITLNGSATDIDGSVASSVWSKVSGPASFSIQSETTLTPQIGNLVAGTYQFRLLVQDNDGAIGLSTMTLTVNPKTNVPPVVSAGQDVTVRLPIDEVILMATATDPDGTITSTSWSQIEGREAKLTITGLQLKATGLLAGVYKFKFTATDNSNAKTEAVVTVTELPDESFANFSRKKFITPNGDKVNDFWVLDPDITKYESCKLVILTNSGEKVFETIGYKNDWDGTRDGQALPQDVYYYLCECTDKKETGSITIIR